MGKSQGNFIAEYGLIMALVVLVAVVSLGYLGSVLDQSYAKNGNLSQANELFGLLGASAGTGGANDSTTGTAPGSAGSALPPEAVQTYANAGITGTFEVPIGSANLASSAEGSERVAETIRAIASSGFLPDGTNLEQAFGPKWVDVKVYLEQMAHYGSVISKEEFNTLATLGEPLTARENLHDIQNNMHLYSDYHEQLEEYVNSMFPEDSPAANSLKNFINTASGVITYGASEFISIADTDHNLGFSTSPQNAPALMKLSGYSATAGDIVVIPVNTNQSANELQQAADDMATGNPAG